jgi:tetratricopeptide (TPR) repeat protein
MIKHLIILNLVLAAVLVSCSGDRAKMETQNKIRDLEKKIYLNNRLDIKVAGDAAKAYTDYANDYADDSLSPGYLFKAGELYRTLKKGKEAVDCYQQIIDKYPNFPNVPLCWFFQGFVYGDILKDYPKAKEYYSEFIRKYPKHDFADDARALISYLGKTDAEMIQLFEEKQKADSLQK